MEAGREMDQAEKIEVIARVCHEANRGWCVGHGDNSQLEWDQAPEWQRESAIQGVEGALAGNTPEQSHESWSKQKVDDGWVHGAVKDPEKKTHPCLVPYAELSIADRAKDDLFTGVVKSLAPALGLEVLTT